ncbi:MAG: amino acid ABC transporter permease [Syntrophomonadaceae bacterium]|nr:amino acid ABC transporter permease [Syntrophomonadaceae bacterium]
MQNLGISVLFMGDNFLRLMAGLGITVKIAMVSVMISVALGIPVGMVMVVKNPITRVLTRLYLDFVRIMPQLVLLFLVYFGLAKGFNVSLSGQTSAVIVFVIWGTAEMADLVRGALISIPEHQYNSGKALGLSNLQIYRYIIMPQTLRRLIPLAMNLATRMVKTTALVVLIGVVEVLKVGQQIIEANRYTAPTAALWIYGTIFFLYFVICYPVSRLAGMLERKWQN